MAFLWQKRASRKLATLLLTWATLSLLPDAVIANQPPPFADIHTHYNWDQKELISAEEIVQKLERENIAFTVVTGTPSHLVQELKTIAGERVVPFFSPYTHPLAKWDWYKNPKVLVDAESGLARGLYHGIGEVHFMVGFKPGFDNDIFVGLLDLAKRYDVPLLVHVDAGSERVFQGLCSDRPDNRFIFAHAGGNLRADHIRKIVRACDNVLVEFSARDPWRYDGLTGNDGQLLPAWRDLILDFPDRFATGTDPVWRVTKTQSWDESDEGWDHFEALLNYHRRWLARLPAGVEQKVRLENAKRFLRLTK